MESGAKRREGSTGRHSRTSKGTRPDADSGAGGASEKPSARILVVEDQDDVRRMVRTALEIEGYEVDEAASAHEGLRLLAQHEYQLVLSDYAMPNGTGAWMIEEATRRGLMNGTPAMIITAHPEIRECAGIVVIYKPLDLDLFLGRVRSTIGHHARATFRKL
jgi:CheY-like chemotaxis protein